MKTTKTAKTATKILFILLVIACVLFVSSCTLSECKSHEYSEQWSSDEVNHWKTCKNEGCNQKTAEAAHSFGEPVVTEPQDGKDGTKVYTCSVCGKTKTEVITAPAHDHTAAADWTSDPTMHWHACTKEDCSEKLDSSNHTWDNGTVTKEAISGVEGEIIYTCQICRNTKKESIPALPEKMSEAEWLSIFALDNVLVEVKYVIAEVSDSSALVKIDGELAEVNSEGDSYYTDSKSEKESFDFSLYYDDFNHLGEGVYYAKSLLVTDGEIELEFTDVTVIISEGRLESMTYNMELMGVECEFEYTFSMWGEVSVELPVLSEEELSAALDLSNYNSYTMDVSVFEANGTLTSTIYYFNGNECYYVVFTGDDDFNDFYENIDNAGVAKNQYLTMLMGLSATDFVYDLFSGMYTYTDGEKYLAIELENGVLASITYMDESGNEHSVSLYDYGTTVIE